MVWPEEISPFDYHLISIKKDEEAEEIYDKLLEKGLNVLYDDRDVSPGEKLKDADLIGCGKKIIVSEKSMEKGGVEYVDEFEGTTKILSKEELVKIY